MSFRHKLSYPKGEQRPAKPANLRVSMKRIFGNVKSRINVNETIENLIIFFIIASWSNQLLSWPSSSNVITKFDNLILLDTIQLTVLLNYQDDLYQLLDEYFCLKPQHSCQFYMQDDTTYFLSHVQDFWCRTESISNVVISWTKPKYHCIYD